MAQHKVGQKGACHIGTSGWVYPHWRETFYPKSVKNADRLAYYSSLFSTVEVNNTFYRLPRESMLRQWVETVPEDFQFVVKASRFITHQKKLREPKTSIAKFFKAIEPLDGHMGPILFQLPPRFDCDAERLKAFMKVLPKGYRYTFEFRTPSWHVPEVYDILREYNAALCFYDLAGYQSPLERTADFIYIRLHGPKAEKYQGSYSQAALKKWYQQIESWQKSGCSVYCYFDNDQKAYAAHNALTLQKLCRNK